MSFGGGGEMYSGHPSNLFLKWNSPYLQTIEAKANPEKCVATPFDIH